MPLEIELTWSWYTVFTMANLFVIHLKSQTMKSVMNEVNWMVERNLGLEWDVDAFLARALKEGLCERWYWGATWMMRKKHPCEDVGSSSKVSSKCKFSETEMRLAALWNRKRTWWHYKVPDIRFRYKCQIFHSKCNGKLLKSFTQESDKIIYIFERFLWLLCGEIFMTEQELKQRDHW